MAALAVLIAGCSQASVAAPTSGPTSGPISADLSRQTQEEVLVDARVVPIRSINLDFLVAGPSVADLLVKEGDSVTRGTPLARLDQRDLQLALDQARAVLLQGEAEYEQLAAGATSGEIAQARASLAQAQARLAQVRGGVSAADLEAAEARLAEARARRALLEAGPRQTELQVAQADRDQAQLRLDERRTTLSVAKEQARQLMEEAANLVRIAQQNYSDANWQYQRVSDARASTSDPLVQTLASDLERRRLELSNAESVLQRALVDYEAAKKNERNGIADAEAGLQAAQARLDQLVAGPTGDALASARAAEAEAVARLEQLKGTTRAGAIDEATAVVAEAQARLDDLIAGPQPADLDRAAALLEQRRVQVRQAELNLERATLVAPIDAMVAEINVEPGEIPGPDSPAMLLADTSAWQLEASEIGDLNIVQVKPGASVKISFDALPDLELSGQVKQVSPLGQNSAGETLYTVYITPNSWDSRLRWNMLAQVRISL